MIPAKSARISDKVFLAARRKIISILSSTAYCDALGLWYLIKPPICLMSMVCGKEKKIFTFNDAKKQLDAINTLLIDQGVPYMLAFISDHDEKDLRSVQQDILFEIVYEKSSKQFETSTHRPAVKIVRGR